MTCISDTPRWRKQWQMDRGRGLMRKVSPSLALQHIRYLRRQGMNDASIADSAGLDKKTIGNIRKGKNKLISRVTHNKIMSATLEGAYDRRRKRDYVPQVGATRRLRALMAMGWRRQDLTPLLGFEPQKITSNEAGWIGKNKHDKIRQLYEELWDTEGPGGPSYRKRCLTQGFAPPMAWDDDNIDNPAAKPGGIREAA